MLSANAEHLADVRASIQRCLARLEQQAIYSEKTKGNLAEARGIRVAAGIIERELIGGEGCVIAAFDHRLPDLIDSGWLK